MINQKCLDLTKKLINIKSINGTSGEKDIALFIEEYFRSLPYFKAHPNNILIQKIPEDALDRRSVIVVINGTGREFAPGEKIPTILVHGHIDTVGIDDFGPLREFATKPDELLSEMKKLSLPDDIRNDLESGDFLFGRGASDMKSGDSVFMVLMKEFSEHPEELCGNIVASFNPVEENAHTGIITSLPAFKALRDEKKYDFICALNNDFTTKLYPDDPGITIYTGMGGKILPCFYILGRETHVGQCFEGLDASLIATKLMEKIEYSSDFADLAKGEMACPPIALKMKDLKDWYNVQTSKEAFLYFNYFVYEKPMGKITEELLNAAKEAVNEAIETTRQNQKIFDGRNHLPYSPREFSVNIMSFDELFQEAIKGSGDSKESLHNKMTAIKNDEEDNGTDVREMPIALIRYLMAEAKITDPTVVLYYAPPFVPHCCVKYEENHNVACAGNTSSKPSAAKAVSKNGQMLYDILSSVLNEVSSEKKIDFRILRYYPSLSDSSYLSIDDDEASIDVLKNNFPLCESTMKVPIEEIKDLSIPTLNIGDYGSDAHKWTERVNIPYTFGVLPELERRLILRLLGK